MDEQVNELLKTLKVEHRAFVDVAQALDIGKRTAHGVCGEWSPKDVVAHLVGWDASLKGFIVDIENFVPPYDVHGFNEQSVAARAEMGWAAVIGELKTNFAELEVTLDTVTPEMRIYPRVVDWLPGRVADYQLHTGQLEKWVS